MKRAIKWLAMSFGAAIALIAILYGVLVLINRHDEPLSPEAMAFAAVAGRTVPEKDNGYFAIVGLRAARDADPYAAGLTAFHKARDAFETGREPPPFPSAVSAPKWSGLCDPLKVDCPQWVAEHHESVARLLDRHRILLRRVEALDRFTHIQEPYVRGPRGRFFPDREIPEPDYALIWRLGATASAFAWVSGKPDAALAMCATRVAAARRLIADANDVLGLALGMAWLRAETGLLSELLAEDPVAARANMQTIEALLAPLDAHTLQNTLWVHGEFANEISRLELTARDRDEREAQFAALIVDPEKVDFSSAREMRAALPLIGIASTLMSPLYQPHATANSELPYCAALAAEAQRSPAEIGAMAFARGRTPNPGRATGLWTYAYNPVGKRVGIGRWSDFLFRLHDLNRMMSMVRVQAALVQAQVPRAGVKNFIEHHAIALDPATGRPMSWDPARSMIYIPALDPLWARMSHEFGSGNGMLKVAY